MKQFHDNFRTPESLTVDSLCNEFFSAIKSFWLNPETAVNNAINSLPELNEMRNKQEPFPFIKEIFTKYYE